MFQFLPTSPAVAKVLLLTLATTILTATSNHNEAYYQRLDPGYSYEYLRPSSTDKFYPSRSLLECSIIALNSGSEFFSYNKVSHFCKNYPLSNIMTVNSVQDSNEMSYFRRQEWIKAYALSMGANSSIYNSIINRGDPSSWNVDKCIGAFCPNFFRHPILDFWNHLPIDEVKLVLYKNQTAVVTMVFNGQHSTIENWFSKKNLRRSPWKDLLPSTVTNFFSFVGESDTRRFYVSSSHKGCPGDAGWLTINEHFLACPWEESLHFPTIQYSHQNTSIVWGSGGYSFADSMAIFIRLMPKYPIT